MCIRDLRIFSGVLSIRETKLSDNQLEVEASKYSELVIRVFSGLDDLYSNTSLFSPSGYTRVLLFHKFQSSGTVFRVMIDQDVILSISLEGLLYGKIFVLFFTLYPR